MTALRQFPGNQSGAISVIGALSIMLLLAVSAVVIDAGSLYLARRNLQSTNDAAALAAVQNPSNAMAIAIDVFTRNGYSGQTLTATQGTYTADKSLSSSARFVAGNTNVNAVKVTAQVNQGAYFAGIFGLSNLFTLTTKATAARVPTASFGAGTRVAQLNAGLINTLLGKLWGSNVSLSLIDYQSLLNTNIDALTFLNNLATAVNATGTYQQLANTNITTGQLLTALIQTAQTTGAVNGSTAGALLALKSLQLQLPGAPPLVLSNLLDLSPLNGRTIGNVLQIQSNGLSLNLMNILSASARTVANGQLINLGTAITIPVTNSSVGTRMAVGNQMVQLSNGQVGSSVRTAQIRLALTATLINLSLPGILTTSIQVPMYLEAASGQATLIGLPCKTGGTLAQISATTGGTTLQFGTVSDTALKDFSTAVTPIPTPLIATNLLGIPIQVNISGTTSVASGGPTTLSFTQAECTAGTLKSAPVSGVTPFSALGTNLSLSTNILGSVGLIGAALNTALSLLTGTLVPLVVSLVNQLDAPVNSLLTALGLQIGVIDIGVSDVSCRTPTLVG